MALMGSWHFNENDTANVRDYSTNGLDSASVSGLTIVAADRGLAGRFVPGSSTQVNFGDVGSPGTNRLTISFKVKFSVVNTDQFIIDKDGEYRVELDGATSKLIFSAWVNGAQRTLTATVASAASTWYSIICIYDSFFMYIYIDGVQRGLFSLAPLFPAVLEETSNDLLLGHGVGPVSLLDADLEVAEIRDADLTTDEIATLDKNMGGIETTLLTKHSFSEGDLLEWVSDVAGLSSSRVVCTLNKDDTTIVLIIISGRFVPGLRYRRRGNVFDTARQWLAEIKETAGKPYIFFSNEISAFGSDTPDASSVLDLSGVNDRGALFPSLTTTERDAIASPATGLFIFNETTSQYESFIGSWGNAATPAGADKQIQFNDGGAFGGDANFTWDKSTQVLSVTGDADISQHMAIGANATINNDVILSISETITSSNSVRGFSAITTFSSTDNTKEISGGVVGAIMSGTTGGNKIAGLDVSAINSVTAGTAPKLIGMELGVITLPSSIAPADTRALEILAPTLLGTDPTNLEGINIANQGNAGVTTSVAINIEDQSGSTNNFAITTGLGNVGFGLLVPITNVQIQESNTDTVPALEIEQLSTGDAALQFSITGDAFAIGIDNTDDSFKISYAAVAGTAVLGTNDRFIIDSTGNIGMGISPLTHLHISGSGLQIFRLESTTAANNAQFDLHNDGGIGQHLVMTNYGTTAAGTFLGISLNNLGTIFKAGGADLAIGTLAGTGELILGTNNVEALRINNSQQVGIGVTPQTNLHILESNTDTVPTVEIEQTSTGDAGLQFSIAGDAYAMGIDNSDADSFKISYAAGAGTAVLGTNDFFVITSAGQVQIPNDMLLGTNGTVITHIKHGSVSVDPPNLLGNSEVTITVGITGLLSTDRIFMTPPHNFDNQLIFKGAKVVTSNTVTITIANYTTGAVNGAALNWDFLVIRP